LIPTAIQAMADVKEYNKTPSFHISKKTQRFLEKQSSWVTIVFPPNLTMVEIRINRNLKKDICALK
jgi:hypothetical protein